jgi:hypothetical protein
LIWNDDATPDGERFLFDIESTEALDDLGIASSSGAVKTILN